MIDQVRRDSMLTVVGLSLLVAVFLFLVYLPGRKVSAAVERETAQAEQSIREIPRRIAELESLQQDIRTRNEYLHKTRRLLPRNADLHTVIRQVAYLANNSGLMVTRLEPVSVVEHDSYRTMPFRLSFKGRFRGMAMFLRGLEGRDRLFTVESFSLKLGNERAGDEIEADLHFSVYSRSEENAENGENNGS